MPTGCPSRLHVLAGLLIVLPAGGDAKKATAFWPGGNDECPCIDPFADGGVLLDLGSHASDNSSSSCSYERKEDDYCYAASYGANGCKAYDEQDTPGCSIVQTSGRSVATVRYMDAATPRGMPYSDVTLQLNFLMLF
jgi:hypothetical protein